jgi:hypothetical protein
MVYKTIHGHAKHGIMGMFTMDQGMVYGHVHHGIMGMFSMGRERCMGMSTMTSWACSPWAGEWSMDHGIP